MAIWKYRLIDEGKALRREIDNGDSQKVLSALIDCYKKIIEITGEIDNPIIDDAIEDIEFWVDDPDVGTETVDGFLCAFYDTCDDLRIWIEL